MAHVTSYKVGGAIGVLKHDERSEHDHVQERKNESIDNSRTHLNYNMAAKRSGTLMQHIKRVCDENNVRLSNRKDLNVMCSWVVTAPKTVKPAELPLFFKTCFDFLEKKYGKQYTLSATVHMDETTPHLHYCFLPVGLDKKNNRLTVSSKLVLSRSHLRAFHKELESELKTVFGRELGIENGATKEGNQTVAQLKQQSKLAAEIERQRQELQKLAEKSRELAAETEKMQKEVETLTAEKNRLQGQIKPIKACFDQYNDIEYLGKTKLGGKVVFSADEAKRLKKQACAFWSAQGKAEQAEQEKKALIRRYSDIDERLDNASNQVVSLKVKNQELENRIAHLENVIRSNPDLLAMYNKQAERLNQAHRQHRNRGPSL